MKFTQAFKLLLPYKKQIVVITVLAIVLAMLTAISPMFNEAMIDEGLCKKDVGRVALYACVSLIIYLLERLLEYIQRVQEIKITEKLGKKLKTDVFVHGLKLKSAYIKNNSFFETIENALFDVSNIMMIADSSFFTMFVVLARCIGAFCGLFILNSKLTLIVIAIIPIKIVVNVHMNRKTEKASKHYRDENKNYNAWFSNIINGIIDIKLWNMMDRTTSEFGNRIDAQNKSSRELTLTREKNGIVVSALELFLTTILYILGAMLIGDNISLGGLVAFVSYTGYALAPVNLILHMKTVLNQISPSVQGLLAYNDLEEERDISINEVPKVIESIEFKSVCLELNGKEIIRDFSATFLKGEKIALIGDNGSGKSTIISLLLGLYEPTSGEILVNGIPVDDFSVNEYRYLFSTVTQDIHLFKGTISDNLKVASEDIIAKSAKIPSFCKNVISKFEKRYDTSVGADGATLSSGEKQKVALMRALYRDSQIIVLDEVTSNYDHEYREEFNKFFVKNDDYSIYILISHDSNVLELVDKAIRIVNGHPEVVK